MPTPTSIAVVIPAYRVAEQIGGVIAKIPPYISHIIVVDDASPDALQETLRQIHEDRLYVERHESNQGVGAAMKTGFAKALSLGAEIIVKIDGDGQMDPAMIPEFIAPIEQGEADLTKGNRFADLMYIKKMPVIRRLGNLVLSFLVKIASGYWHVFDPTNGFIAINAKQLRLIMLRRVEDRYFFEISLLCEAYFADAVLKAIPMKPVYGNESSSLRPAMITLEFMPKLLWRTCYRILMSYFLRDFNVVTILLLSGLPVFLFGVAWSIYHWIKAVETAIFASTGTVMIGALSIILGFQLLLQAIVLDVQNEPGRIRRS